MSVPYVEVDKIRKQVRDLTDSILAEEMEFLTAIADALELQNLNYESRMQFIAQLIRTRLSNLKNDRDSLK